MGPSDMPIVPLPRIRIFGHEVKRGRRARAVAEWEAWCDERTERLIANLPRFRRSPPLVRVTVTIEWQGGAHETVTIDRPSFHFDCIEGHSTMTIAAPEACFVPAPRSESGSA